MPTVISYTQLYFDEPINVSVQIGDTIWYVDTTTSTPPATGNGAQIGTTFEISSGPIREVGEVIDIIASTIVCRFACNTSVTGDCERHLPSIGDFIMFSKDNAANMSSILGYYAEVEMSNDSNEKAKLFAVSTDISESSK